jgi:uncharacterized protein (TIGR02453 family)
MGFEGWSPTAVAWFEGLEQDNSRDYFTRTRDVYERAVKGPLLALLAELEGEFGQAKMFRPNRDVRFSADKSPYKTQASAVVHAEHGTGDHYVEVSMDGLLAGSGAYQISRDQLVRYRQAVDEPGPGEELAGIVDGLRARGYQVHGEALKTAPRGFSRDHPRASLLRHKGLTLFADLPPGRELYSRRALDHVRDTWRAAAPLNDWLSAHVGATEEVYERR